MKKTDARVPAHLLIWAEKTTAAAAFAGPQQRVYARGQTLTPSRRVRALGVLPAPIRWWILNAWTAAPERRA